MNKAFWPYFFRTMALNRMKLAQSLTPASLLGLNKVRGLTLTLSTVIIMALILGNLAVLYSNLMTVHEHNSLVTRAHKVLFELEAVLSTLKDTENSTRAFVLTQKESFLEASQTGRSKALDNIRKLKVLTDDDSRQQQKVSVLWDKSLAFMRWQSEAIDAARSASVGNMPARSRGPDLQMQAKPHMDEIRLIVQDMKDSENQKLEHRANQAETATYRQELSLLAVAGVSVLLVLLVQYYIRRFISMQQAEARRLSDENWLKTGLTEAAAMLRGKDTLEEVGRATLEFLAGYLGMQVGAFYVMRQGHLQLVAGFAKAGELQALPTRIGLTESLAGEALQHRRPIELEELPADYLKVSSALGSTVPSRVIILPLYAEDMPRVGVVEMGFLKGLSPQAWELFDDLKSSLSVAVASTLSRQMQQELLEETQRQAEELAAQQEELRASNEKLEQQTAALRSSQDRLQQQQEELRQSNEELEQQAQAMAQQKQKLAEKNSSLLTAKSELESKARELEQASRYKSEFLANMSHELRTPLNSLLLLATLLAENKEKTLTDKQVDFARTIFKSGRDLLSLINDILDLSKVEAGRLELVREAVDLEEMASHLKQDFEFIAAEKGLPFEIRQTDRTPSYIITDSQRLLQIMKNLVSNALKFTEAGLVEIIIDRGEGATPIQLQVRDTGIGICPEKQSIIFEAFKQSDGSINRTYGGTGLGLTISKELAQLLGGFISVRSEAGVGSTFTLHLPEEMPREQPRVEPAMPAIQPVQETAKAALEPQEEPQLDEPLEPLSLTADDRLILVVEDDVDFGRIMSDLALEAGFKTVVASRGETALRMAAAYPLSAILLDIKLPDMSGLSVLERLKADSSTRHIPIHIVSGTDYVQNALALGAMGYLQKPAPTDQLKAIFERIEATLNRKVKRVLLVEDDKFQRQATKDLLGQDDIAIIEARSGAEAREKLWHESFDCVVLDLRLPDISGFEVLEAMESKLPGPKPPIVVYTAKDLSLEEQKRLERSAESIVIKGARSPERLLDEVSLFLHRLESSLPLKSQTLLQKLRSDAIGLKGRRILLVDDDMRNVYALVNALANHGLHIAVARNGRESLSQLEKDSDIELVLMDIMMPEMDGYEAMRLIRENPLYKKLPVIALTAKAMKGDLEQCLLAGANDYLPKPVNLERLLSLLKVWLPQKI
jgi:CheY-like chemotaxis protein/CHASE3 domain sensor protein